VDGDALLRRWLTQQHELGDQALVLPSLTARQAVDLMRHVPSPGDVERAAAVPAPRAPSAEPNAELVGPPAGDAAADWRAELTAAGAAPGGAAGRRAARAMPDERPVVRVDRNAPLAPTPDPSGAVTIDALAELIAGCRACELFRTALNPVPGEGNPNADLVCIGEAPGATEDSLGRPFVGQAGQLLTKILAAVNLSREDVFIMNVLKHRPPGNRNPDPSEVRACQPFLRRQLELIKPKVILALGTFAAQTLLETKASIGKLRGQVHQYQGIPVVVTYHPAALLRNPAWKRPTWEDVQLARRILDGTGA
jgi:DNA polymerase